MEKLPEASSIPKISFQVCDVPVNQGFLKADSFQGAISKQVGQVEACSKCASRIVLTDMPIHRFIQAMHIAFAYHFPLVISPDHIWLLITQGFAMHVRTNAEKLRHQFVQHDGKKELKIRRDDLIKGSPNNPWDEVVAEFGQQIQSYLVDDVYNLLVPEFSTTTPVEKTAFEIVLMDAMQDYFKYFVTTLCGIPSITLEGSPADWRAIQERTRKLSEYGLGWWTKLLDPILDQFIRASEGQSYQLFWQSMYKHKSRSGGDTITGWIIKFFPYIERPRPNDPTPDYIPNPYLDYAPLEPHASFGTKMLPSGISYAPFGWEYLDQVYPMRFGAGFMGVSQDPASRALRSEIGWFIQETIDPQTMYKQVMRARHGEGFPHVDS